MTRIKHTVLSFILMGYSLIAMDNNDKPLLLQQELKAWECTTVTETPDFNVWLFCFLHSLVRRIEQLEFKMKHEQTTCSSLSPLATELLQVVYNKGKVTMTDIMQETNIPRSTIKKYLSFLIDQKYITRHGKGRATWYTRA